MRLSTLLATTLVALSLLPGCAATTPKKKATTHAKSTKVSAKISKTSAHHAKAVPHAATPGMDPERATQIQTALIHSGYLSGEPSGKWDADSIAAVKKLQADHGWQTKVVPDARAIIALGLGPQNSAN